MRNIARCIALYLGMVLAASGGAVAATLRLAAPGDVLSMDPHSSNISFTNYFLGNVYEGLVAREPDLKIVGRLAERWDQPDPLTWIFHLRPGVRFHDGTELTSDDVLFSFERSRQPTSNFKHVLASVESVSAPDRATVAVKTKRPNPILLNELLDLMIVSRAWATANGVTAPLDLSQSATSFAALNANGTGSYRLVSRARGSRTELQAFPGYWQGRGNIDSVVFTPIENASTLVSALLSGEVDLVMPLPLQDAERVQSASSLKTVTSPETRVIFIGMDVQRDALLEASVQDRNPFKDRRVREAIRLAIDPDLIVSRIMGGQALVASQLVVPQVTGYDATLSPFKPDLARARRQLADAGYPSGFSVGMDCPVNQYVNDSEICQALASMLGRIGVKLNLTTQPRAQFFQKVAAPNYRTSMYLLGWTPATLDALNAFQNVLATRNPAVNEGQWNIGGCSVPDAESLWKSAAVDMNTSTRTEALARAMAAYMAELCVIPLHSQRIVWGARRDLDVTPFITGDFPIRLMNLR